MAGDGRPLVLKGVSKPGSAGPRIVSLADADLVQIFASFSRERQWFVRAAVVMDFLQRIPECIKVNRSGRGFTKDSVANRWCERDSLRFHGLLSVTIYTFEVEIRGSLVVLANETHGVAPRSNSANMSSPDTEETRIEGRNFRRSLSEQASPPGPRCGRTCVPAGPQSLPECFLGTLPQPSWGTRK